MFFIVTLILNIGSLFKISALAQLDLPFNDTRDKTPIEKLNHFQTNGHTDKVFSGDVVANKEQSNEISIGDTLHYDRDRSHRYGPPYTDENDRRYYNNNENRDGNYNPRHFDRNLNGENEGIDDDDKYYTQPRSPYYVSEKQRNRLGYRDYYSTVRSSLLLI